MYTKLRIGRSETKQTANLKHTSQKSIADQLITRCTAGDCLIVNTAEQQSVEKLALPRKMFSASAFLTITEFVSLRSAELTDAAAYDAGR